MNTSRIIPLVLSSVGLAFSLAAGAATDVPAAATRWTFDGGIHNNSLALSPDQTTAIASYSESPDVVIHDLASHKVRATLHGFVTPRNVVFDPSGKSFYVSDSSLGQIRKIDTATLQDEASLPAGAGAFGTTISQDGNALYVNNEAANTVTSFDLKTNRTAAPNANHPAMPQH